MNPPNQPHQPPSSVRNIDPIRGNPYFDPHMPVTKWNGNLPHMEQMGKIHFVTFRLADSLPQSVIQQYQWQKEQFERTHPRPWDAKTAHLYGELVSNPVERFLDAGYGSCVLGSPAARQLLVDALEYYDGTHYRILAYVIMPNHVHMLAIPMEGFTLAETVQSVMRYSATRINRLVGRKGQLWQTEPYDRIVRNHMHYRHCVEYIRHNPDHLPPGSYCLGGIEFQD